MKQANQHNDREVDLKSSLLRVGDLINLEGPLLSLFLDNRNNDLYIFDWIESKDKVNRWLVYKVSAKVLNSFIHREISYKELFNLYLKDANYYYADIINSKESEYSLHKLDDIPIDYFPTEDIFFEENDAKNITQIIRIVNRIIVQDNRIISRAWNYISIKEFSDKKKRPMSILRQTMGALITLEVKSNNTLSENFSIKIEAQQNVRENNRLSEKERLDFHLW
jgi:hypothetical protein